MKQEEIEERRKTIQKLIDKYQREVWLHKIFLNFDIAKKVQSQNLDFWTKELEHFNKKYGGK